MSSPAVEIAPSGRRDALPARLLITGVAAAVPFGLERILLPFVDARIAAEYGSLEQFSIASLGVGPIVGAFALVELASVAVPPLSRKRSTPEGRQELKRAAYLVCAGLALLQAAMISGGLFRMDDLLLQSRGLGVFLVNTLTMAGCTAGLAWVASIVDRHGIGSGLALLAATGFGVTAYAAFREPRPEPDPPGMYLIAAAVVIGTWLLLTRGPRALARSSTPGAWLRHPTAGVMAVNLAAAWLMFVAVLSAAFPELDFVRARLMPGTVDYSLFGGGLAVGLALLFTWLLARPPRVAALWARAFAAAGADASAWEHTARASLRSALLASAAVAALPFVLRAHPLAHAVPVFALILVTGVALDVANEVSARSAHGPLVPVWPLARPYEVEPALAVLEREGIPACARSAGWATLLPLNGYAPVWILVRPADAERAAARLRELIAPS